MHWIEMCHESKLRPNYIYSLYEHIKCEWISLSETLPLQTPHIEQSSIYIRTSTYAVAFCVMCDVKLLEIATNILENFAFENPVQRKTST